MNYLINRFDAWTNFIKNNIKSTRVVTLLLNFHSDALFRRNKERYVISTKRMKERWSEKVKDHGQLQSCLLLKNLSQHLLKPHGGYAQTTESWTKLQRKTHTYYQMCKMKYSEQLVINSMLFLT